jgi:hypothetical protein
MMVPNAKPTRNADLRHAQSIGRQRQAAQRATADVSPEDLADIASHDEAPFLAATEPMASGIDASPADTHRPSWRDSEPAIVHSLKWHDADGHEHLHIVRGDTLDEVLLHLRTVKVTIAAARTRDAVEATPGTSETVPLCPDHQDVMSASKYGGYYCGRKTADGTYCKRKVKGRGAKFAGGR